MILRQAYYIPDHPVDLYESTAAVINAEINEMCCKHAQRITLPRLLLKKYDFFIPDGKKSRRPDFDQTLFLQAVQSSSVYRSPRALHSLRCYYREWR